MTLLDKFNFGVYKGLTLLNVYQGTRNFDIKQLASYLNYCANSKEALIIPKPDNFQFCEIKIVDDKILLVPEIFDPEKPLTEDNRHYLGDLTKEIEIYYSHFFKTDFIGVTTSFREFNSGKNVIGADPEYIKWCMNNVNNFIISEDTKLTLESLPINRLEGIEIVDRSQFIYYYKPKIRLEKYKF